MTSARSDADRPTASPSAPTSAGAQHDDDPFPLPDSLQPIADRKPVVIREFANMKLPSLPTIKMKNASLQPPSNETSSAPAPSGRRTTPRSAIVAALQSSRQRTLSKPPPAPPLSKLLCDADSVTCAADGAIPIPSRSFVTITVYHAHVPTPSARICLCVTDPLSDLVSAVKCTSRPPIPSRSTMLYLGGTLFHSSPDDSPNYAAETAAFLQRNGVRVPAQARIDSATLEDLTITLGRPYLFLHAGDCEHLVIFTDIFRASQAPAMPPSRLRLTPCDICGHRAADCFTVGDPLADASPFHYCSECFSHAHISASGAVFNRTAGFRLYNHYNPLKDR